MTRYFEGWDMIIEDNVRVVRRGAEAAIREIAAASPGAHLRYYSFNGKHEDIKALFSAAGCMGCMGLSGGGATAATAAVAFPTAENQTVRHPPRDASVTSEGAVAAAPAASLDAGAPPGAGVGAAAVTPVAAGSAGTPSNAVGATGAGAAPPGGAAAAGAGATFNPLIWGTYAYSIGPEGYDRLMLSIRADVGTIVWRPKRAKKSHVKGMDRVMPRKLLTLPPGGVAGVSAAATVLSAAAARAPVFFRGPQINLFTDNLLENTDGMGGTPSLFSRGGSPLPFIYADARCIGDVIAF